MPPLTYSLSFIAIAKIVAFVIRFVLNVVAEKATVVAIVTLVIISATAISITITPILSAINPNALTPITTITAIIIPITLIVVIPMVTVVSIVAVAVNFTISPMIIFDVMPKVIACDTIPLASTITQFDSSLENPKSRLATFSFLSIIHRYSP